VWKKTNVRSFIMMAPNDEYDGNGGWREWSQWVRLSINELKAITAEHQKDLIKIKVELGVMKTKMAIWGALGATAATLLLQIFFTYFRGGGGGAP